MDLVKILIGLGVGLLDESLAEQTFGTLKAQDAARVGLFVAGLAVDFLGRGAIKVVVSFCCYGMGVVNPSVPHSSVVVSFCCYIIGSIASGKTTLALL